MKVIAIAAVTAGGKTTVVNEIKNKLPKTAALHLCCGILKMLYTLRNSAPIPVSAFCSFSAHRHHLLSVSAGE